MKRAAAIATLCAFLFAPAVDAVECADFGKWIDIGCRRVVDTYANGKNELLVSGYSSRGIELEKLKHVQAAFLQKPFSPHTLLLKVREILDAPATATTTEESLSDGSESPVNRH